MRAAQPIDDRTETPSHDPAAEVVKLAEYAAHLIAMSQALVSSHRHVDLQGLQDLVGLLCAKTLDVPPSQAGFLKLQLKQLVSALDELHASLRANAA